MTPLFVPSFGRVPLAAPFLRQRRISDLPNTSAKHGSPAKVTIYTPTIYARAVLVPALRLKSVRSAYVRTVRFKSLRNDAPHRADDGCERSWPVWQTCHVAGSHVPLYLGAQLGRQAVSRCAILVGPVEKLDQ